MAGKAEANEMKLDKINYDTQGVLFKINDAISELENLDTWYENGDYRQFQDIVGQIADSLNVAKSRIEEIGATASNQSIPNKESERKNVYVCSAYGGKQENYEKAVEHCKQVADAGYTPIASHVMLHGIINDDAGREQGLQAGLDLVGTCDELWVFGETITDGMAGEMLKAVNLGIPVENYPEQRLELENPKIKETELCVG